jgi:hypothetical protein
MSRRPQVVQARLWAQGTTLGLLLGAGYIAHERRKKVEGPVVTRVRCFGVVSNFLI